MDAEDDEKAEDRGGMRRWKGRGTGEGKGKGKGKGNRKEKRNRGQRCGEGDFHGFRHFIDFDDGGRAWGEGGMG